MLTPSIDDSKCPNTSLLRKFACFIAHNSHADGDHAVANVKLGYSCSSRKLAKDSEHIEEKLLLLIIQRWVSRELLNVTDQELEVGNLECDIVNGSVTQDQRHQLDCLHSHLLIFGGEILEDGVKKLYPSLPIDVANKPF